MDLDKLVDKMFVRTIYWENWCHSHLLKIVTYALRNKPNKVREYVWQNNYGAKPNYDEISVYYLDESLKFLYAIKSKKRLEK